MLTIFKTTTVTETMSYELHPLYMFRSVNKHHVICLLTDLRTQSMYESPVAARIDWLAVLH
jgi:hypothetical protein